MAQHVVGMYVSSRSAKLAIFEATMRRASLVGVKSIPIGDAGLNEEFWTRVHAELPKDVQSLVYGLDGRTASTRLLTFPFGDMRKVEAAIDFELEGQVPYALEDIITTWSVVSHDTDNTHVLAGITPKAPLRERLNVLTQFDLEPRGVLLPAAALAELAPHEEDGVAVVSLGTATTHLCFVKQGLRFARTLRAGSNDIDRSLGNCYNINLDAARIARELNGRILKADEPATPEAQKLSQTLIEGLQPLVTALMTTFRSVPKQDLPARILIAGGLSRLPGLVEFLRQRFEMPVELLDIKQGIAPFSVEIEEVGPEHAIGIALGLSALRHGRALPLNFRRGELAYQGDIQMFRGQIKRMVIGTISVLLLATMGSVVRYSLVSSEEKELSRAVCTTMQKIVGREICDPTAALATLKQAPGAAEGVVIPSYSAPALFEMMSRAVASDIDVQFDEIDLRVDALPDKPDSVTAKGEAASFEAIEQLTPLFKRDPCVSEVEVSKQRKTKNSGRVEFNLTLKIACPAGTAPGQKLAAKAGGLTPGRPGGE